MTIPTQDVFVTVLAKLMKEDMKLALNLLADDSINLKAVFTADYVNLLADDLITKHQVHISNVDYMLNFVLDVMHKQIETEHDKDDYYKLRTAIYEWIEWKKYEYQLDSLNHIWSN